MQEAIDQLDSKLGCWVIAPSECGAFFKKNIQLSRAGNGCDPWRLKENMFRHFYGAVYSDIEIAGTKISTVA